MAELERRRKTLSPDQQYGCLFANSKCKVRGCCLIKFPPKDFQTSYEQEAHYLPGTTCTPAEMVRLTVRKKRQLLGSFICSFDDMHDSQATPPIVVQSGSGDMRVTFPPWFGETLSDARVAPGMKCKWTLKAVWKPQRRGERWVHGWLFGWDVTNSEARTNSLSRADRALWKIHVFKYKMELAALAVRYLQSPVVSGQAECTPQ